MGQLSAAVMSSHEKNVSEASALKIIAIGASAGGSQSLKTFFKYLKQTDVAIFIAVHGTEQSERQLQKIIASLTTMQVELAENGMDVKAKHVYIAPSTMFLNIINNHISLRTRGKINPKNLPIDHFFTSLAKVYTTRLTAIVFSGAGSDGSKGLPSVKKHGGLCLVQDDSSAEFSSMPQNAGRLANAQSCEPKHMPRLILEHHAKETMTHTTTGTTGINQTKQNQQAIFDFLSDSCKVDLNYYQPVTLQRRLEHRLTQLKISAPAYLDRLRLDPKEVKVLAEYLLVIVTEFFRDGVAFDAVQEHILSPLSKTDKSIRIWVPGCATGQEAYSLAIALMETYRRIDKDARFKIFATDISDTSIKFASKGQYKKEELAQLPQEILERYFEDKGKFYQATESLRNHLIFAQHDLCNDPPFTRVDFVSCRNLLIYFKEEARQKVLSRFHFSLNKEGYLFLGPSENVMTLEDGFKTLSEKWKLYQKQDLARSLDTSILTTLSTKHKQKYERKAKATTNTKRLELISQVAQPGFLLNADFQLLETFGNAHEFLSFSEGQTDLKLNSLLKDPIAQSVRASLFTTARTQKLTSVEISDDTYQYQITTQLLNHKDEEKHYFVTVYSSKLVQQFSAKNSLSNEEYLRINELEIALERKEEELQTTIEELETSNEELTAANEEMMAANEELQAVNEELHSVNEELHTVNVEYQDKLHAVNQANNDLMNLHNVAEVGTVFIDEHKRIRSYSPLLANRFNFIESDMGRPIEHLIYNLNVDLHYFRDALNEALESGKVHEFETTDHNRTPYWLRLMPYLNAEGHCEGAAISLTEISQLKQAQARVDEHNRFAENLIAATPGINYVYVFGVGRRTFAGNTFTSALGYNDKDETTNPRFLPSLMHPEDAKRLEEHNERLHISKTGEAVHFEFRVKHQTGKWVWMETRETVHKRSEDESVLEVLGIALDISSRKGIEERLQYDTLHDSLTGLRNRIAFIEHLDQTHRDFLRYPDQNYAVLFIDLDRFKNINDSYGHSAGDYVLKASAMRIAEAVRDVDVVARHSGDEFLILAKNMASERDAAKLAKKIIKQLEKPIKRDDVSFEISASIGIAMANPDQESPEFLINSADIAMYKSKKDVAKNIHVFDDSLHIATVKQLNFEHDLRSALRENHFFVHYQPIIDIQSHKIVALEALARWSYEGEFISPSKFIPVAEASQLIGKIDKAVFEQACLFLESLPDKDLKINLNLSAKQLANPNTLEYLLDSEVDPKRLCLEITESQLLLDSDKSIRALEALNAVGYNLAIDDFGTGYSSLSYLQRLPAKTLKIDRSFVQSIETNEKSREIISAIMHLAQSLDYKVVAEGIETQKQLEFVTKLNCNSAQGYLFSRPIAPEACIALLADEKVLN